MQPEELEQYTNSLVGRQLISFEKKDWSWFFRFSGDISVATEESWRLILENRIFVTSEDHDQLFGLSEPVDAVSRVLSSIADRTVSAAVVSASTGDLTIEFSGQVKLQFLQMSGGYESWRLSVQGTEIICMGGGKIVLFP